MAEETEQKPRRKRKPRSERSPAARAKRSGQPCRACTQDHPKCNGHVEDEDGLRPCRGNPINGGDVCSKHGGQAPQVVAAAKARLEFAALEGKVGQLLRLADLPEQHPIDGLLEVVRHTGAMMRMIGHLVSALGDEPKVKSYEDDDGVKHFYTEGNDLYGLDHTGDQAPHVLVLLYEKWAKLYKDACKTALDANIDERLVRQAETSSDAMFKAFVNAVQRTGLPMEYMAELKRNLADELRALTDPLRLGGQRVIEGSTIERGGQ